jgi:alkaline phosphatase D
MKSFFFLMLFSSSLFAQTNAEKLQSIKNITRFAFGSCNDHRDRQPLWNDMIKQRPDLFIWGGDNIYADWERTWDIRASYEKQNNVPGYAKLKEQTPIIGTWDDHDYAWDNANGTFQRKDESQQYFLDFVEEPVNSPRRFQKGIYTSYEFGDPDKRVKFLVLDNRYFKDLDSEAPLLGQEQWAWLEEELASSTAALHFFVMGLSITSPAIPYTEEWVHYPSELNRMLKLLSKYKTKGVVFLSGDKHFSSMFMRYGHLEFMASGMTHLPDRRTWWYLGRKFPATYFGYNYGQVDISWENASPVLRMSMRTSSGRSIHASKFTLKNNKWIWH